MRKLPKHIMHLQMLFKELGGREKLANELDLSVHAVTGWVSRNKIPDMYIKKLARLSNVFSPKDFEDKND